MVDNIIDVDFSNIKCDKKSLIDISSDLEDLRIDTSKQDIHGHVNLKNISDFTFKRMINSLSELKMSTKEKILDDNELLNTKDQILVINQEDTQERTLDSIKQDDTKEPIFEDINKNEKQEKKSISNKKINLFELNVPDLEDSFISNTFANDINKDENVIPVLSDELLDKLNISEKKKNDDFDDILDNFVIPKIDLDIEDISLDEEKINNIDIIDD